LEDPVEDNYQLRWVGRCPGRARGVHERKSGGHTIEGERQDLAHQDDGRGERLRRLKDVDGDDLAGAHPICENNRGSA
jgi:hypothetical protein